MFILYSNFRLKLNFKMDLRKNTQCFKYFNDIFHENTLTFLMQSTAFLIPIIKGQFYSKICFFCCVPFKVTYAVIIIPTQLRSINIEVE